MIELKITTITLGVILKGMNNIIKKNIKKVLNEIDLNKFDDVIKLSEFLLLFQKDEMALVKKLLSMIRELGIVNMFESGQFLFMTKQHFLDMIRFKSYERNFDEDKVEEISEIIGDVRDVIIRVSMRKLSNEDRELTDNAIMRQIRNIVSSIVKYYITGDLKYR